MTERCRLCGRKLTTPKSIKRGYGPVCYERFVDELWEPTERDMPPEPIGQTIFTKNARDTLKTLKKMEKYDSIIQDEDPEPTGAGHSKEQDAVEKINRKMR